MKIVVDELTGVAKVIEPVFVPQNVYLGKEVVKHLDNMGAAEYLPTMRLSIKHSVFQWVIYSDSSGLFAVTGFFEKCGDILVCRLW